MRLWQVVLVWIALYATMGCKRLFSPQSNSETTTATSSQDFASAAGKPDKTSEEPTGLPGYPLLCDWAKAPAEDPEARLNCFLAGEDKKPVKEATWEFVNKQPAVQVRLEAQADGHQLVILNGQTANAVMLALNELELIVRYQLNGPVVTRALGRDLIKSAPGAMRIAGHCRDLMTIMAFSETGEYQFTQFPRFDGCETLAANLLNIQVPDPAFSSLLPQSRTILAVCTDGILSISVNQPVYQGTNSLTLNSARACQDLAAFINAQAI
ncbi:hypothetical protein [Oligoflexus tunisiensis]|uniref:hypothetical protein n=1 Tax=Oligoflexus tunisiensis TaxID=708132 RepID=UPI00114CF0B6|nr:hypothetical protein [Oligoflexus tunisiensis]